MKIAEEIYPDIDSWSREMIVDQLKFHAYHHERLAKIITEVRLTFAWDSGIISDDVFAAVIEKATSGVH